MLKPLRPHSFRNKLEYNKINKRHLCFIVFLWYHRSYKVVCVFLSFIHSLKINVGPTNTFGKKINFTSCCGLWWREAENVTKNILILKIYIL